MKYLFPFYYLNFGFFIFWGFVVGRILVVDIFEDEKWERNSSENFTFAFNGEENIENVILFYTQSNMSDFNFNYNNIDNFKVIKQREYYYYLKYSVKEKHINITVEVINLKEYEYIFILSRFTKYIDLNQDFKKNIEISNSPLIYKFKNYSNNSYNLAYVNSPHNLFYYNETIEANNNQILNRNILLFDLEKEENIYLIVFPENNSEIHFEIKLFDKNNYSISMNNFNSREETSNFIKIDEPKIYYLINSFNYLNKYQYLYMYITYGNQTIFFNNETNKNSVLEVLPNKSNGILLNEKDIKSNSYYDIFQIECKNQCLFYFYYINESEKIKDKLNIFFSIENGKNKTLEFSNKFIEPSFFYECLILNKEISNETISLNNKQYNIKNEEDKRIMFKHNFYEKELNISSVKGDFYGIIYFFFQNEDYNKMRIKQGEKKIFSFQEEISVLIEVNNSNFLKDYYSEIIIYNNENKTNKICSIYQIRNNNKYFKPSKFYCLNLSNYKNISSNIENEFFPNDINLNLFFYSENSSLSFEYFLVLNKNIAERELMKLNNDFNKAKIQLNNNNNNYIIIQLMKCTNKNLSFLLNYNNNIYKEDNINKINYYKIIKLEKEHVSNNNYLEIKGESYIQYNFYKGNDSYKFDFPENLNIKNISNNETHLNLIFDELLENEDIKYELIIKKIINLNHEKLENPCSIFNVKQNEKKEEDYLITNLTIEKKENKLLYSSLEIPSLIQNEILAEYIISIIGIQKENYKLYFTYNPIKFKISKIQLLEKDKPINLILRNNYQNLYLYTETNITNKEEEFFMIEKNISEPISLSYSCLFYDSKNSIENNILYRYNKSFPRCSEIKIEKNNYIYFIVYDSYTKLKNQSFITLMIYTNNNITENINLKIYKVDKPKLLESKNDSIVINDLSLPKIYILDIKNFSSKKLSLISFVNKDNILKVYLGKVIGKGYKENKNYLTRIYGFDESESKIVSYFNLTFFFYNFKNEILDEEINFELIFNEYKVLFQDYTNKVNDKISYQINCDNKIQYIIRYYDENVERILFPKVPFSKGEILYKDINLISNIDELLNSSNYKDVNNLPIKIPSKYSFLKIFCSNNNCVYLNQYLFNNYPLLSYGDLIFTFLSKNDFSKILKINFKKETIQVKLYSEINNDFYINDNKFLKNEKINYINIDSNNSQIEIKKNSTDEILLSILIPINNKETLINESYSDENMGKTLILNQGYYLNKLLIPNQKSFLSHYRFILSKKAIQNLNYSLETGYYPYIPNPIEITNKNDFILSYNDKIILKVFTYEMNETNKYYYFIIYSKINSNYNLSVSYSNEFYPYNNQLIRVVSQKNNHDNISLIQQNIIIKLYLLYFLNFQIIPCHNQCTNFEIYFSIDGKNKTKYELANNEFIKNENIFLQENNYAEFEIYGDAIFKHSIYLISNNEKNYSKGNFKIEVEQGLRNITIKIPIEPISFSYEVIFFIAENTKENYIIFEEPCELFEIAYLNKTNVNIYSDKILCVSKYDIDKKYCSKEINLNKSANYIIRVIRNDSSIYGNLELSEIFQFNNKTNYFLWVLIIVFVIILILIIIFVIYKYKKKFNPDSFQIQNMVDNINVEENILNRSI